MHNLITKFSPEDAAELVRRMKEKETSLTDLALAYGFSSTRDMHYVAKAYLSGYKYRFHLKFYKDELQPKFRYMTLLNAYIEAYHLGYTDRSYYTFRRLMREAGIECLPCRVRPIIYYLDRLYNLQELHKLFNGALNHNSLITYAARHNFEFDLQHCLKEKAGFKTPVPGVSLLWDSAVRHGINIEILIARYHRGESVETIRQSLELAHAE